MKKQTKLWKCKDGHKIRICDMTDNHLANTIKFIEKYAQHMTSQAINLGYQMLGSLQGEMAIDSVEHDLAALEEDGYSPCNISIYGNLQDEVERRSIIIKEA